MRTRFAVLPLLFSCAVAGAQPLDTIIRGFVGELRASALLIEQDRGAAFARALTLEPVATGIETLSSALNRSGQVGDQEAAELLELAVRAAQGDCIDATATQSSVRNCHLIVERLFSAAAKISPPTSLERDRIAKSEARMGAASSVLELSDFEAVWREDQRLAAKGLRSPIPDFSEDLRSIERLIGVGQGRSKPRTDDLRSELNKELDELRAIAEDLKKWPPVPVEELGIDARWPLTTTGERE